MERLSLEFPRSLAVYDSYTDAQRAVDYLSDKEFAVENVLIVGTDLKQVERVIGRLTWTKVLTGGLLTGMWLGLFVGLIFSLFTPTGSGTEWIAAVLPAVLTGAVFGAIWAAMGYVFTRGRRDFTSVTSVVATKYEILVEHRVFDQARDLLAQGGMSAGLSTTGAAGAPGSSGAGPARPNPYEGRYGAMRDDTPARSGGANDSGSGSSVAPPPAGDDRPRYGERLPDDAPPPQGPRYGEGGPSAPPNPRD